MARGEQPALGPLQREMTQSEMTRARTETTARSSSASSGLTVEQDSWCSGLELPFLARSSRHADRSAGGTDCKPAFRLMC